MKNLINKLLDSARKFSAFDFAVFKVTLLSIGVLLGAYFASFFLEYISVIWIIAIFAWVILMYRVIKNCGCNCKNKQ